MKKFSIIALILMTLFTFGCSKKDTSDNMVKLNKVDISAISNQQIKNFLTEASEHEGIYKIETKSNTYIYFNGIKNEFIDINCSVEDNTLNIESNTNKLKNNDSQSQKLYVIYQKNTTISNDKTVYFDTIKLTINGKESSFKNSFVIKE